MRDLKVLCAVNVTYQAITTPRIFPLKNKNSRKEKKKLNNIYTFLIFC